MSDLFGWDLIYAVSAVDIKKKEDVLTLVIHFVLIRNGYRCIGLGASTELTGKEESTEILPKGWNSSSSYTIRYVQDKTLYVLRGIPVSENMVFNLLQGNNLNVSNVAFNTDRTVNSLEGPLTTLLVDSQEVFDKIKTELIDPHVDNSSNKEATTQTPKVATTVGTSQSTPILPSHVPQPIHPGRIPGHAGVDPFWIDPERDPLRVGRSDLDPFGRGGGMIFNPFDPRSGGILDPGAGVPGGLPRGAIPPGARFDPFGPQTGPNHRPRPPPDADHFPPPGFDGMFM